MGGHGGDEGAREVRSLGARHGPAPSSQQGEQLRRATTARATTAASAQKVDVRSGGGAVMGNAENAWWCHGGDEGAREGAHSARGTGRR